MSILELAEQYMMTTKPSELKKQKIHNYIDAVVRIRHYLDLQEDKKVKTQFKKVV